MANLTQVAKKANVSVATASLVLNRGKGWQRISENCAKRVRAAADELDYASNYHMRSMRRGRADVLGLIVESGTFAQRAGWNEACIQDLMRGIGETCRNVGMDLMTIRSEPGQSAVERGVLGVRERKLDALIAPWFSTQAVDVPMSRLAQLPIIVVEPVDAEGLTNVCAQYDLAIKMLMAHLAEFGHQRVLWLEAGDDQTTTGMHLAVATEEARALNMQLEDSRHRWPAPDQGDSQAVSDQASSLIEYLSQPGGNHATAILCANPTAVALVQQVLWQSNLRVPDDISVAALPGCTGNASLPKITTVDLAFDQIGQKAAELALEVIELDEAERAQQAGQTLVQAPQLVQGQTTGPLMATHR